MGLRSLRTNIFSYQTSENDFCLTLQQGHKRFKNLSIYFLVFTHFSCVDEFMNIQSNVFPYSMWTNRKVFAQWNAASPLCVPVLCCPIGSLLSPRTEKHLIQRSTLLEDVQRALLQLVSCQILFFTFLSKWLKSTEIGRCLQNKPHTQPEWLCPATSLFSATAY